MLKEPNFKIQTTKIFSFFFRLDSPSQKWNRAQSLKMKKKAIKVMENKNTFCSGTKLWFV